MEEGEDMMEGL